MPYEIFLALRYFSSRKRRTLARVTTFVAIAGVAFGVAVLIIALALANGFVDEMRDKILNGSAHITITRRDGAPIESWRDIATRIDQVGGVIAVYPTTYDGAMLIGPASSSYGVIRGVDSSSKKVIDNIRRTLVAGNAAFLSEPAPVDSLVEPSIEASNQAFPREKKVPGSQPPEPDLNRFSAIPSDAAMPVAIIGEELASRAGLVTGDIATLVSAEPALTPVGVVPRYRKVKVAGIFRSGLFEYDSTWVYMSLAQASDFAGRPGNSPGFLSVETADAFRAGEIAESIRSQFKDEFEVVSWQEVNQQLFAALALERRMGVFILGLIVVTGVLNVTSTLVLVVAERRADIAILAAMGASPVSITTVFILEGGAIGLTGAIVGVLIGTAAIVFGNHFKLVSLPSAVYSVGNVPFHIHSVEVVLIAAVALGLSLIATIYPALVAARMRPVESLQG